MTIEELEEKIKKDRNTDRRVKKYGFISSELVCRRQ